MILETPPRESVAFKKNYWRSHAKEAEQAVGMRRSANVKLALRQFRSVKPRGDTAHDYGANTAVRSTTRSRDVPISRQFQNAELLG